MKRATIAGGALATAVGLLLFLLALPTARRERGPGVDPVATTAPTEAQDVHPSFLYGRVALHGGAVYEGRLRWGTDEEAFWDDFFNGVKRENPWAVHVPPERLPKELHPIEILGFRIVRRERPIDLRRPFMVRFGDIARVEARGRDVLVTLKSGATFVLDRFSSSDFDDGVRVWDARRGDVKLAPRRVHEIELLPAPGRGAAPDRLHGTVRTRQGDFTGFILWNRQDAVGSDTLDGRTAEGERSLRFDTVRSIARRSSDSALVTLLDGREIVLSDTREVGEGNRGIYVDDRRRGRVLISWDVLERVDFGPGGSGRAYDDFAPGRPLAGTVTVRDGRRLTGRLVYDLDESETTETLDAPFEGVAYSIPFERIASIVPDGPDGRSTVTLDDGDELRLERAGDLASERNAGLLAFVDGHEHPDYVPWGDVVRIDFGRP